MNDFLSNVKKVYNPTNYIKVTARNKISEIARDKAKLIYLGIIHFIVCLKLLSMLEYLIVFIKIFHYLFHILSYIQTESFLNNRLAFYLSLFFVNYWVNCQLLD